jgi:predicted ATP-dependent protease
MSVEPLPAARLCWRCDVESLGFATTDELVDLEDTIGQRRALEAIRVALGMRRDGYNIFVLGPDGIGRHTIVRRFLERQARHDPAPHDWCYVGNFQEPRKPRALRLRAGLGSALEADMRALVEDARDALKSAFEHQEYRSHRQVIDEELKERQEQALAEIEEAARERGIALIRSPLGFAFAPLQNNRVMPPERFQELPPEERRRLEQEMEGLGRRLKEALAQAPLWMQQTRDKVRRLNEETAEVALGHLFERLRARYREAPEVLDHLGQVRRDMLEHIEAFLAAAEATQQHGTPIDPTDGHPMLRRYRVNLMDGKAEAPPAPVVYEDDPTFERLIGRIDQRAEMGTLVTDFLMVRPGALHRANGGYLVVDARKLLTRPLAWEALKRALTSREIRIEPMTQALGLFATISLEPEPIPLGAKVVLIGERLLYYLLAELDPEFRRLFKIAADFDEHIERNEESQGLYARLVATLVREERLRALDRAAVARLLEHSARLAGDAGRLSTEIERLLELLREADHYAGQEERERIGAAEVERAWDAHIDRLDRVRERVQEEIARGTILIDTDDRAVGQVNGLSVAQLGGLAFGRPSRITARVRLGSGDVVDIEREVALGGPLHSKGVLILAGYLSGRYASDHPLSLHASLVFEQSYGGVEGDSASSAELYALLSALAGLPLEQGLAVTGSVDQRGRVQAIGGVNEKIEGFFDVCRQRGLTGRQGVLVPEANLRHLMLHRRVVEAAAAGRFHIYPIATIDQGIELLTGVAAGERDDAGRFPEDTVNARVEARLIELALKRRAFVARGKDEP